MNPATGSPPTLEWIGVDRLAIDESYQRATDGSKSKRLIRRMTDAWNWHLCQPLVVSRRADGSLFVIDGQHRLEAAAARGDLAHLPCVVVSGQDAIAEASAFVALNTNRQQLAQCDIFNAMVTAGDPTALSVDAMLHETGWKHARHSYAPSEHAGMLNCGPMIVKLVQAHGECPVRNTLAALREAYQETPVANTSTLIKALLGIFTNNAATEDPDALVETIASCDPRGWEDEGQDVRRASPSLSRIEAIREAMLAAYRDALTERRMAA